MTGAPSVALTEERSALRRFVDGWCRVTRLEREGRIYERLGLRPVFGLIAGLFGESLPPPSSVKVTSCTPDEAGEWRRVCVRTRYYETLNLIAIIVYTPFLTWLILYCSKAFAGYCLALVLSHIAALLLERYKRARCDGLLTAAGIQDRTVDAAQIWRPLTPNVPPVLKLAPIRWYFTPKRFESERHYRALGMGPFRAFVLMLIRATGTAAETDAGYERIVTTRSAVHAFEAQTRVAEATHLMGMAEHVPFLYAVFEARNAFGAVYLAFMLAVNLYCVMLQRWHRLRVWPVVQRMEPGFRPDGPAPR